jgi:hypothetical protein
MVEDRWQTLSAICYLLAAYRYVTAPQSPLPYGSAPLWWLTPPPSPQRSWGDNNKMGNLLNPGPLRGPYFMAPSIFSRFSLMVYR